MSYIDKDIMSLPSRRVNHFASFGRSGSMKWLCDTVVGTSLIVAVVAAAIGYARHPELQHCPVLFASASASSADGMSHAPAATITVSQLDWSADGTKLLSRSRGDVGGEGPLVLHDVLRKTERMSIDVDGEPVATALLSPDGLHVLVASVRGKLWWIGLESLERTRLVDIPPP